MTQQQIDSIKAELTAGINTAATIATTVAPEYGPYIMLGKAVALAVPELYEDMVKLVQKAQPTDVETSDLAKKIAALASPETL